MEASGKTAHYVSNNSLRTKENYDMKFKDVGIEGGYVSTVKESYTLL